MLIRLDYHLYSKKEPHLGPTWRMIETCKKYNLLRYVIEGFESGVYMEMVKWKKLVYETVKQKDLQRWRISCTFCQSMSLVNTQMSRVFYNGGFMS